MAPTTTSPRLTFADKLRSELDRRTAESGKQWGARTVARLMVDRSSTRDLEQTRRAVRRWLSGMTPTQANRDEVTDALGLERGSLDPDAEEEDPVARATRLMNAALANGRIDDALRHMAVIARAT